jgi:hypothetical protein
MEFIPGEDLCCILEDQGEPFKADQVLDWADQLLDALEFLHSQEIPVIHRDIKPQNLKLSNKGQIVLLDFGLAKGNPTESNNKTAAKSIFGYSRNYASLEQIQGTGTDPRSDLYSLAATLYHLVTGIAPEDALTRAMAVLSAQQDPLIPAHIAHPDVPPGLSAILHQCLDLNAGARPGSAAEMRSMLREHDSYAHLAARAGAAGTEAGTYAPNTRSILGHTNEMPGALTEAKTQLLPGHESHVTRIRRIPAEGGATAAVDPVTTVSGGSSPRRFVMAAGGLGVLLLVWAVAGGVYFYTPVTTDAEVSPQMQLVPPVVDNVQTVVPGNEIYEGAITDGAETNTETPSVQPPAETRSARKQTETAPSSPSANAVRVFGDEDIVVDGDTVYMGNRKITPDGIEEIDPASRPVPRTPLTPGVRPPAYPRVRLDQLTPEQRRKLRALRRMNFNMNVYVAPSPTPE